MSNLLPIIENSFTQYSAAVIQSRALVDARDGLKPSARQIFYSMLLRKLTPDKPYKKTANAVGMAMADFYIHGDSSAEGVIMRAGQSFAMRYPLVDVKGNSGSLIESGNWAAMRYTESRLSKLGAYLFSDIDKETITEWKDNYDNTKQYPAVLPTKGYYNVCNGSMGIAVGLAASIPQYNLKEMNEKLEYLLLHPDCEFEDIYIAPDFATGAILLNENEVKNSMKKGNGCACKLRSVVEYDNKDNCFVVTEIPYGVYTNTICGELEDIINGEENPGIDRFNDLTGKVPLIKIYLTKKANPDRVLKYLYKNTSLQSHYGINFTMLDGGRFPKVFTWKAMLQAHIDHEKEVYRRGYEFDLRKIKDRLHIINGLLIAIARVEEVIRVIKASESTKDANINLQKNFLLDEAQAAAVLKITLSKLAHLEAKKYEDEKVKLEKEKKEIEKILNDEELLNNEIIKDLRSVANKYGDERRTKILNIESEDEEEPKEIFNYLINLSNQNRIYLTKISSLYTQKRGRAGSKFKMRKGERIISSTSGFNTDSLLCFSKKGRYYKVKLKDIELNTPIQLETVCGCDSNEKICEITTVNKEDKNKTIIFATKDGYIKRSKVIDYANGKKTGALALKLNEGDELVSIFINEGENIGVLTKLGNFILVNSSKINTIGRMARGSKGIKLNEEDSVVSVKNIDSSKKYIVSISKEGYIKKSSITDFGLVNPGAKGSKIQKLKDDSMVDFLCANDDDEVIVVASNSQIKISASEISLVSRGAQGTKAIKLKKNDRIAQLVL